MNTGVIAARYARALLGYADQRGSDCRIYGQAVRLVEYIRGVPMLGEMLLKHQALSFDKKLSLMESALDEPLDEGLVKFLELVRKNDRMEYLLRIMLSFINMYRKERNIRAGHLVTAVPVVFLAEKIESLLSERTGAHVVLDHKTDPSIIGGFVFEMDGYRLDASARGRLDRLRKELVEENSRLV